MCFLYRTLLSVNNLGSLLEVKDEDPIKVFREALAEKERKLGKNNPQTLFAVFSLGALLRDKSGGSNDEAVKLFRRALVGFDRLGGYGPEHPHTKFIAESLGMLLKHTGLQISGLKFQSLNSNSREFELTN